jgi:heme/copper-type cytochrome/quinol oxidase subunit 3
MRFCVNARRNNDEKRVSFRHYEHANNAQNALRTGRHTESQQRREALQLNIYMAADTLMFPRLFYFISARWQKIEEG